MPRNVLGLSRSLVQGLAPAATLTLLLTAGGEARANPQHGQTFKDWTARCETTPGTQIERCYIFQNIVIKESNQRVLHMAVGYLAANGRPAAVLTMPLGISLPPGVSFGIDDAPSKPVVVERCDPSGCIGATALDAEALAALKAGRQARVDFYDGTRRKISVPVSLLGFTAGFATLQP